MPEPGTPDPRNKTQIFPAAKSSPASHGGEGIARLLVEQGLITEEQLTYTKRVKTKLISDRSMVEIFKELRLLTN